MCRAKYRPLHTGRMRKLAIPTWPSLRNLQESDCFALEIIRKHLVSGKEQRRLPCEETVVGLLWKIAGVTVKRVGKQGEGESKKSLCCE